MRSRSSCTRSRPTRTSRSCWCSTSRPSTRVRWRTCSPMQTALRSSRPATGWCSSRNHVYVIPPNVQALMRDERSLTLLPRPTDRSQYTPIDAFLRSLAEVAQDRAIACHPVGHRLRRDARRAGHQCAGRVHLRAGTGHREVRRHAACRDRDRADRSGGLADRDRRRARAIEPTSLGGRTDPGFRRIASPATARSRASTPAVLGLLRAATGVDFTRYKPTTIQRRLQRRMVAAQARRPRRLHAVPQREPRRAPGAVPGHPDPRHPLLPRARVVRGAEGRCAARTSCETAHGEQPIRLWVCGCSTGEEAYSLAITVLEYPRTEPRRTCRSSSSPPT